MAQLELDIGRLAGTEHDGVRRFAGIPYGHAPRFGAPRAADGWSGVLDSTDFGSPAWQPRGLPPLVPGLEPQGAMAEDCLNLTVWSPDDASDLPVLVWVHGGSFLTGAPSLPVYDGAALARRGAVVVSVAYRLGPFGFVSFDDLGGTERGWIPNAGLHDVALALEWVRAHVQGFGGDPRRVTVFGESAGGGVILHLLGAPQRERLFDRAIVQSGSAGRTFDAGTAALVADRLCAATGGSLDALAAAPAQQVIDATAAVFMDRDVAAKVGMMAFHPCIDGSLVRAAPSDAIPKGAAAGCDLISGVTRDEMALFLEGPSVDPVKLTRRVARYVGVDEVAAGALLDRYADQLRTEGRRAEPIDVWAAIYSDREMVLPARRLLDGASAHHGATFGYLFGWSAPDRSDGRPVGAAHAVDLPFTFDTFATEGWDAFVGATGSRRGAAGALCDAIQAAWVRFAADGDPGWAQWSATTRSTMVFDEASAVQSDPIGQRAALWIDGDGA